MTPKGQRVAKTQGKSTTDAAVPASCTDTITPTCLKDLYGIPATKATQSTNVLGVSGFIEQFANNDDLQVCFSIEYDVAEVTYFRMLLRPS